MVPLSVHRNARRSGAARLLSTFSRSALAVAGLLVACLSARGAVAGPTPAPSPSSSPHADALPKLFYVVGSSGTEPLLPLVVNIAAQQIQASLFPRGNVWVVPRPVWDATALEGQCQTDPTKQAVVGGLVLDATAGLNGASYFVLVQRGWQQIDTDAQLVDCTDTSGNLSPAIIWIAHALKGYRSENAVALVTVAGAASYLASANSASAGIALGASLVAQASSIGTFPTINQSSEAQIAANRLAQDIVRKLIAACAAPPPGDPRLGAYCAEFGWGSSRAASPAKP